MSNLRIIDLDVIDRLIEDEGKRYMEANKDNGESLIPYGRMSGLKMVKTLAEKEGLFPEEIWNAAREEHLYDPDDIDSFTIPKYETLNDYLQSLNKPE